MYAIKTVGLCKRYKELTAVESLSLEIKKALRPHIVTSGTKILRGTTLIILRCRITYRLPTEPLPITGHTVFDY